MDLLPSHVPQALHGAVDPAAADPLLIYCDDATGERTELSAAEVGRWVARTASLLRDGCGLSAGDRAAVLLPPHWQSAAVLLGAWSISLTVSWRSWATAGLDTEPESIVDVVFVARDRLGSWLETVPPARHRFVLGLATDGARLPDVPTGYRDYLSEIVNYSDLAPAYDGVHETQPATPEGTTFGEWASLAREIADALRLRAGDRLLVDTTATEQPVRWLLAPLIVGASVVLCANLEPSALAERARAEGATHVLS